MSTKVRKRFHSGIEVEVEADNVKDAIKKISPFLEVFSEERCGKCGSTNIRWEHRVAKGFDFYSAVCNQIHEDGRACQSKLDYGQKREGGGLWPKYGPGEGWRHWKQSDSSQAASAPQSQSPTIPENQEAPF